MSELLFSGHCSFLTVSSQKMMNKPTNTRNHNDDNNENNIRKISLLEFSFNKFMSYGLERMSSCIWNFGVRCGPHSA